MEGLSVGQPASTAVLQAIDLSTTRSLEELFAVVGRAAKDAKPGDVIVSNSDWHRRNYEKAAATARGLINSRPYNPFVLVRGGHEFVLNSAAFAKWNVTKNNAVARRRRDPEGTGREPMADWSTMRGRGDACRRHARPDMDNVLAQQRTLNQLRHHQRAHSGRLSPRRVLHGARSRAGGARKTRSAQRSYTSTCRQPAPARVWSIQNPCARYWRARRFKQDEGDEWVRLGGVKLGVDAARGRVLTKPFVGEMGRDGTYFGINTVPARRLPRSQKCWPKGAGA